MRPKSTSITIMYSYQWQFTDIVYNCGQVVEFIYLQKVKIQQCHYSHLEKEKGIDET